MTLGEAVFNRNVFALDITGFLKSLAKSAQRFAERIYTIFRWAVTDDFLRRYGGTP